VGKRLIALGGVALVVLTTIGCGEGTDKSPMNAPPAAKGQDPKKERGYSEEERKSFDAMPK